MFFLKDVLHLCRRDQRTGGADAAAEHQASSRYVRPAAAVAGRQRPV
jgi:hypothetical protein